MLIRRGTPPTPPGPGAGEDPVLLPEAERDEAARRLLLEQIETVATAEFQGWARAHRAAPPALRAPDHGP
ncbi:hypothetical protein ACWD33_27160 [Streptomyces xiamenensis]|uniref:Uncharacterized protein n=1 Tax=Streptomyces xiamenensis TaxID=408015 RepID=A0A0F7G0G0_9ACTN|nr:hypothetical protein [Streptomyces xiamenensis]AKG46624.1 hypothetical protein SXIM_52400 [Streptomyces xiamenensis]